MCQFRLFGVLEGNGVSTRFMFNELLSFMYSLVYNLIH